MFELLDYTSCLNYWTIPHVFYVKCYTRLTRPYFYLQLI